MVAYKTSDVKLNWNNDNNEMGGAAKTCGYIKEGLGKSKLISIFVAKFFVEKFFEQ